MADRETGKAGPRSPRLLLCTLLGLVGYFLLAQLLTRTAPTKNHLEGVVRDEDGRPVAGVTLRFEENTDVFILPVPYSPRYRRSSLLQATTDSAGKYHLTFQEEFLRLLALEKTNHHGEMQTAMRSWRQTQVGQTHRADFSVYHVNPMEQRSVVLCETAETRFAPVGSSLWLSFDPASRTVLLTTNQAPNVDLEFWFDWLELPAHGAYYGKFRLRAVDGGVWVADNDMPYAPADSYEPGIRSSFSNKGAVIQQHHQQIHFYARTRGGTHHLRVLAEVRLHRPIPTLRVKCAVNPTGSRLLRAPAMPREFADVWQRGTSMGGRINYKLQPWWMDLHRTQLLVSEERLGELLAQHVGNSLAKERLARHWRLPENLANQLLSETNRVVHMSLARNPSLPDATLVRLSHFAEARDTLKLPKEAREFLSKD